MSARILRCLDLCEASGLFRVPSIEEARARCAAGLVPFPLPVPVSVDRKFYPSPMMSFHDGNSCSVSLGGTLFLVPDAVAVIAATLSRVATLARECDRVMGGGE